MSSIRERLDSALYPRYARNWDDALFRRFLLRYVRRDSRVLDFGAGAGIVASMNFRGLAAIVCGIDLDPRVLTNANLDEGRVADGRSIPYPDEAFDLVFADNVLEHLDEPVAAFREVCRVLSRGGMFAFKTPNRWHYMPLVAQITPLRFHKFINRSRGRAADDTFPTRYRANSRRQLSRLSRLAGFRLEELEFIEGRPEYLRFSWPTYLLGAAYERLVNSSEAFEAARGVIMGTMRKR